jgi:hypothetical protein
VDVEQEMGYLTGWKGRIKNIWPIAGVYGIVKAIHSGEWKIPYRVRIAEMDVVQGKTDTKKNL